MTDRFAPRFGTPIAPWHWHFAWRPVNTLDRGWRWLTPVYRRRVAKHAYLDGGADLWWQHAVDPDASDQSPRPKDPNAMTPGQHGAWLKGER